MVFVDWKQEKALIDVLAKCAYIMGKWQRNMVMSAEPQAIDRVSQFQVPATQIEKLLTLGFDKNEIYTIVAPRRTLDRRLKNKELLTIAESDRVTRLERIMAFALQVFGDAEKAEGWLRDPNRAMNNAAPIDLLASESGAYEVETILGRIQYGMFS